ncbi:hypothetical protein AJ79_07721 [Helicocarpus griseus UAMH5409]|uniref:Uncharacterized protein n=1 Tax=Helicocarpus griseus UAMH5409 TaxID=1447875 RepID=A0A2B7WRS3_9EURO|nr:hypothetical protein AJ79_07721 [Helicocarpus griseus UAMH5409]
MANLVQQPLQSSLRRSGGVFSSTSSLRTIIQPSRPAQRSSYNRFQAYSFSTTPYTQNSNSSNPAEQKDNFHDRSRLDPTSTETTKSGTHGDVAAQNTAFKPETTAPESELEEMRHSAAESSDLGDVKDAEQKGKAGKNPLEVSGANQDVSASKKEESHSKGEDTGPSKRGSPAKSKQV